uniref:NBS-LRR protein n=1 Tax=Cicer arietinum TaxID=3827 RepID=W0M152_CICAR|nr:NBS-LRR protein [Cicer arietinum]
MAETAVWFVLRQVYQLLKEEQTLLKDVSRDLEHIKNELEFIRAFLKDADQRATSDTELEIKAWVKQLRELSFRIEDVVDQYIMDVSQHHHHHHHHHGGYIAKLQNLAGLIKLKTIKPRHRVACEIQDIKLSFHEIKERSKRYNLLSSLGPQGSITKDVVAKSRDPDRLASLFIEEDELVGFEKPRDEIVGWLVDGEVIDRSVISVVGMGGLGKTTLAKNVFDNPQVKGHFDCRAFLVVSQSYNVEALLRNMMMQFSEETKEPLPRGTNTMDKMQLITLARSYLQSKRKDSCVQMHKLQSLPPNKAWELFCNKAFRFDFYGNCPPELKDISEEIVQKCEGLPLAIVAVGGLLSTKDKTVSEWKKLCQNLSLELDRNPHLANLPRILGLSYEDLPHHLKSCMLYFGIYPEDYSIRSSRLIRQWIAEGFVKHEVGKSLEEVGEEYLIELIHRSLVHVSRVHYDGKATSCRIHDLLREMIMRKMKDLSFCHVVREDNQEHISDVIVTIRRLAVETSSSNVLRSIEHFPIRSLYIFNAFINFPDYFGSKIFAKSKLLKVLDLEGAWLNYVPDEIGNLFHLKYLSLRYTNVKNLPKSIGKLQNLETLDLKETLVCELPSEINRLLKLRHLLVYCRKTYSSISGESGVKMMEGVGGMTVLQKLYHIEVNHGGLNLIAELRKLRQLRKLGLKNVKREYGNALCDSIKEMNCLESLHVSAINEHEIIDLQFISSLPQLRQLHLFGRLEKLPNWISRLDHLVRLSIRFSKLKDDPLKLLKDLPNLLRLAIVCDAYDGEMLHFQVGFKKLNNLYLVQLNNLNSILIDNGACPAIKLIEMVHIPKLKEIPTDIHLLKSLETLYFIDMPYEFNQSIDPNGGPKNWVIQHVQKVTVIVKVGSTNSFDYNYRTICHTRGT